MERKLKPEWSSEERKAGEETHRVWEEFFSASEPEKGGEASAHPSAEELRVADVRNRHEAALLAYPNVVGVSEGIKTKGAKPTGEHCIIVLVERRIPVAELERNAILPAEIEGILVDVVETGRIEPLGG